MSAITLEDLLLCSELESLDFERSSFEVFERPKGKTRGRFQIEAPLELTPVDVEGGSVQIFALIDGQMKGNYTIESPKRGEPKEKPVFQANFKVAAKFRLYGNGITAKTFGALIESKHRAVISIYLNQMYPYIRHHLRIRLVESGFKGVEPSYSVLQNMHHEESDNYVFGKIKKDKGSDSSGVKKKKRSTKKK